MLHFIFIHSTSVQLKSYYPLQFPKDLLTKPFLPVQLATLATKHLFFTQSFIPLPLQF